MNHYPRSVPRFFVTLLLSLLTPVALGQDSPFSLPEPGIHGNCRVLCVDVQDELGQPLSQSRMAVLDDHGRPLESAHGDARGRACVMLSATSRSRLPRSGAIWVSRAGYETKLVRWHGKDVVPVVLERATGHVAGRVVDVEGAPVPGAQVTVTWKTSAAPLFCQAHLGAETDAEGQFRCEGIGHGTDAEGDLEVQVTVQKEDWIHHRWPKLLANDRANDDLYLRLWPTRPLSLECRDEAGRPIPATLSLCVPRDVLLQEEFEAAEAFDSWGYYEARNRLAADGSLRLRAPRRIVNVQVRARGRAVQLIEVDATTEKVALTLEPGRDVPIQVLGPDELPLANAVVTIGTPDPGELENRLRLARREARSPLRTEASHSTVVTGRDGRATLEDAPLHTTTLLVHHPALGVSVLTLPAEGDERTKRGDPETITLRARGQGSGTVLCHPARDGDADGAARGQDLGGLDSGGQNAEGPIRVSLTGRPAIPGVSLWSSSSPWQGTSKNGEPIELRGVLPGDYSLSTWVHDRRVYIDLRVEAGRTTEVPLPAR